MDPVDMDHVDSVHTDMIFFYAELAKKDLIDMKAKDMEHD